MLTTWLSFGHEVAATSGARSPRAGKRIQDGKANCSSLGV